jgi:stage IV sporulation protein FB
MLRLGSIFGTSIRIDLSFLILVALFVASDYNPNRGIQYALLWIPVLLISVLIHELAHAAAIAMFGYGPSDVVLGGMGGVTMNRRKARPWHDMVISIAGPLSSFALAWLVKITYLSVPYLQRDPMFIAFLPMLRQANIWWGIFNLLPVSPLDGGHAVRNLLRMFLNERVAFVIAVWVAIVIGSVIAILGFLARWIFLALLLAWFVYMNYQQWQYYREHGYPGD